MLDPDRVIAQLLSSGTATVLTSRSGRKLGERAPGGGIAAIAGIAYAAFERHRCGRHVSLARGPSLAFLPPAADPEPRRALGLALLRSMVAAARACGKLDDYPSQAICAALQHLDLDKRERALLFDELGRVIGVDEIAASARSPEQAAEIYAAALLAIEADTQRERAWLSQLAASLALPAKVVAEIHQRLTDATLADAPNLRRRGARTAALR